MSELILLQKIIQERTISLEKYVQKENANDFFIKKENQLLANLTQIYNRQSSQLVHYELWKELEKMWKTYEKEDSQFCGITFSLRVQPSGIPYFVALNLYANAI